MEEALESGATQVNNVVHSFRLVATQFDKKSYLSHLKEYMKAVKGKLQETNPDRVAAFEKGAAAFAKKVVGGFKDYEFYTGESMDVNGMVALLVSSLLIGGVCKRDGGYISPGWESATWRGQTMVKILTARSQMRLSPSVRAVSLKSFTSSRRAALIRL